MEPSLKAVIVAAAALFVLAGGFLSGQVFSWAMGQENPALAALKAWPAHMVTAHGFVTFVNGRQVSVQYEGETVTLPIREDAQVSSHASAPGTAFSGQLDFSAVRAGQTVTIGAAVSPEGGIVGRSITILPSKADIR